MKVKTIEQYKILQFIKDNFNLDYLTIELVDYKAIKITDKNYEQMLFYYENGKVIFSDMITINDNEKNEQVLYSETLIGTAENFVKQAKEIFENYK